jgi:hypothetical protein
VTQLSSLEQVEVGGVPLAAILMPLVDHDSDALEQRQDGHLRRRRAGASRRMWVRPLFHYRHRRHGIARARNGKTEQERHIRSARQQKNSGSAIKELRSNSMVRACWAAELRPYGMSKRSGKGNLLILRSLEVSYRMEC